MSRDSRAFGPRPGTPIPGVENAAVDERVRVAHVDAWLYRARVRRPMVTSFARLSERSSIVLRITDREGCVGWGEAYCNFPPRGGEHRMTLIADLFAPRLIGRSLSSPADCFDELTRATATLCTQTGEPGPIAQSIAAIDMALWDLVARRASLPLSALLSSEPKPTVAAYATGLAPEGLVDALATERGRGHRAFKLKLGFGMSVDQGAVEAARSVVGDAPLALDANQAWSVDEASQMCDQLVRFSPLWLEEPLAADAPIEDWQRLAMHTDIPMAAGENLYGERAFKGLVDSGLVRFVQPDPAKWGGITGLARVATHARRAARVFCPHYIGSNLGLAACIHLVAAFGTAESMVEVDPNENPLRHPLGPALSGPEDGNLVVPAGAGLGVEPDLDAAAPYLVRHFPD